MSKKSHISSTRINKEHMVQLRELAQMREEPLSTLARRALLRELARYGKLDEEHVQALGMEKEQEAAL